MSTPADNDIARRRRELGKRLRALRLNQHHSQLAVAADLGVSASAISMWETGRRPLTVDQLWQFAAHFGVCASDLLAPPESAHAPQG
jgi:transcriptional regulator with XRE-family HTH domain